MILFDTGALVAAANDRDTHHHACVELLTGLRLAQRRLLLPTTVIAEVGRLLRHHAGPRVEVDFLHSVTEGVFEPVPFTVADFTRMAELAEQYVDRPLGVTDASIVAVAERLGVSEIATVDRKDFAVVRPRHVEAFTLLPERPEILIRLGKVLNVRALEFLDVEAGIDRFWFAPGRVMIAQRFRVAATFGVEALDQARRRPGAHRRDRTGDRHRSPREL